MRDLAGGAAGLLEVVRDDLDQLVLAGVKPFDPRREAGVEQHAPAFRKPRVRHVVDEDVLERVLLLAGDDRRGLGMNDVAPLEPAQRFADRVLVEAVQRRDGTGPEHRSDDGRLLRDSAFRGRKPVETSAKEALECRRDGELRRRGLLFRRLLQHPDGLLEEERISLRVAHQRLEGLGWKRVLGSQLAQQRLALAARERVELDDVAVLSLDEDRRAALGELGPRRPDQEQRCGSGAVDDEAEQVEKRLFGPVEVLEDDHELLPFGEELEEPADAPVQLGLADLGGGIRAGRGPRRADEVRKRSRDRPQFVLSVGGEALEERPELRGDHFRLVVSQDPAARLTIWLTGQYVIPSPYGRQRPRYTCATAGAVASNSVTRRLLPTPGGARSVHRARCRLAQAVRQVSLSSPSSRSRPINGTGEVARWPGCTRTATASHTRTGSDFPFAASGSAGRYRTACDVVR